MTQGASETKPASRAVRHSAAGAAGSAGVADLGAATNPILVAAETGLVVKAVRTRLEFAACRAFQERHQWHPESNCDLLRAALEARDDSSEPYSLIVRRNGQPEAMLVGQVVPAVVPWQIGYKVVHSSPLRLLEVLHGGVMGDQSPANVKALYGAVTAFLRTGGADAVLLRNVRTDSEVYRVFRGAPSWWCRDGAARRSSNWKMTLPESYDAYRQGLKKRARDDLRRYEKRMTAQFGANVRVAELHRPEDVCAAMQFVDEVAKKTYQRGLGAGFQPTAEARARWTCAAQNGWLRIYVLELGGKPAAFCTGFVLGSTLWLEHIGFDPDLRACQPGGFLLQRVIEHSVAEPGLQDLDFGVGDAEYKRRLCDRQHEEAAIYVFAPSIKGVWLASMRRFTNWIGAGGRWAFGRLGALDRVKGHWRRRIAEKQKSAV